MIDMNNLTPPNKKDKYMYVCRNPCIYDGIVLIIVLTLAGFVFVGVTNTLISLSVPLIMFLYSGLK